MRIQAKPGSDADKRYYSLPGWQWPKPTALAPGVSPDPFEDLIFHGGRTVPKMRFQNVFVGRAADWTNGDADKIDDAIRDAMQHPELDVVMKQYFSKSTKLECARVDKILTETTKPDLMDEPDVQGMVVGLYRAGKIDKNDLDATIYNLVLPRGTVLALDQDDSQHGLGGYHGSVHVKDGSKRITLYYSANVFSEGNNGIDAFDEPWKNVVGTLYHELNEFRTDPDINDAIHMNSNDFLGWTSRTGKEVGDQPIAANALDVIFQEVIGKAGNKVPVQFMYSNRVHGAEGP
jgi:hypothetical protein